MSCEFVMLGGDFFDIMRFKQKTQKLTNENVIYLSIFMTIHSSDDSFFVSGHFIICVYCKTFGLDLGPLMRLEPAALCQALNRYGLRVIIRHWLYSDRSCPGAVAGSTAPR